MTGSKAMTIITTEEMHARRACGESRTDWERLKREQQADIEPKADEDTPGVTAALREVAVRRRAGRPAGSACKEQVAIRFDREVLAAFQATGPGWQTRMNEALRDWLKTHTPA